MHNCYGAYGENNKAYETIGTNGKAQIRWKGILTESGVGVVRRYSGSEGAEGMDRDSMTLHCVALALHSIAFQ